MPLPKYRGKAVKTAAIKMSGICGVDDIYDEGAETFVVAKVKINEHKYSKNSHGDQELTMFAGASTVLLAPEHIKDAIEQAIRLEEHNRELEAERASGQHQLDGVDPDAD